MRVITNEEYEKEISNEAFVEQEHPRDGDGKFSNKGQKSGKKTKAQKRKEYDEQEKFMNKKPEKLTSEQQYEQLLDAFGGDRKELVGKSWLLPTGQVIQPDRARNDGGKYAWHNDWIKSTGCDDCIKIRADTTKESDPNGELAHLHISGIYSQRREGISEKQLDMVIEFIEKWKLDSDDVQIDDDTDGVIREQINGRLSGFSRNRSEFAQRIAQRNKMGEAFVEQEHPRDEDGKFTDKDGSNSRVERQKSILQQEIDYLKKSIKEESKKYRPFEKVSDEDRSIRGKNRNVLENIKELEEELNSSDTVGLPHIPLKPNTHEIETIDNGMYLSNSDSEPEYESDRELMKTWSGMKLGLHSLEGFKKGNSTIKVSIDIKEKGSYGISRETAEKQINLAKIMWNSLSDEERDSINNFTIEQKPSVKMVKNEKGEDVIDGESLHDSSILGYWQPSTNELAIRIDSSYKSQEIKGTFIHEVAHSMYHKLKDKHPERIKEWKKSVEKIPPTTKYGKYNLKRWKNGEKQFKELEANNWEWQEVVAKDSDGNVIRTGKWNDEIKMEKELIPKEDVEKLKSTALSNIEFYKDLYFNEIHSEVHMYMMGQQKRGHMKKTGKVTKGISKFIDPYRLLHDLPKMEESLVVGEVEEDSPVMEVVDITESISEVVIYLDENFERVLTEDEGEYEFIIELNDDMTIKKYTIKSMWEKVEEAFVEQEHPRDGDGKFTDKGTGSVGKKDTDISRSLSTRMGRGTMDVGSQVVIKQYNKENPDSQVEIPYVLLSLWQPFEDYEPEEELERFEDNLTRWKTWLDQNPQVKKVFDDMQVEVDEYNKILDDKFENAKTFYSGMGINDFTSIQSSDIMEESENYSFKSFSMNDEDVGFNWGVVVEYDSDFIKKSGGKKVEYTTDIVPTMSIHTNFDFIDDGGGKGESIENADSKVNSLFADEQEIRLSNDDASISQFDENSIKSVTFDFGKLTIDKFISRFFERSSPDSWVGKKGKNVIDSFKKHNGSLRWVKRNWNTVVDALKEHDEHWDSSWLKNTEYKFKYEPQGMINKDIKESFKEQEHPRDGDGKFTDKGGSSEKTYESGEKVDEYKKKIKEEITPTKEENEKNSQVEKSVIDGIRERIKGTNYEDKIKFIETQGSFAKGTDLAGSSDLDIFVGFDYDIDIKEIEEVILELGDDVLKPISDEGEYKIMNGAGKKYPESYVNGVEVQIIGTSDITLEQIKKGFEEGGMKTATDRSPHHTRFMKKALKGKEQEVRTLKKFFKNAGVYDASIAKQGFSGFSTEVLIHNLGSFDKVLEFFANFEKGSVVGETSRKFDTPLVMVDPIDENRNLASAFSHSDKEGSIIPNKNLARLIKSAQSIIETGELPEITKEKEDSISIDLEVPENLDKNEVYSQAYSSAMDLQTVFKMNGYGVMVPIDKITDDFEVKVPRINVEYDGKKNVKINFGLKNFENEYEYKSKMKNDRPKEQIDAFMERNDDVVEIDGTYYARVKRVFNTAEKFLHGVVDGKVKNVGLGVVGRLENNEWVNKWKTKNISRGEKEYENITGKIKSTESYVVITEAEFKEEEHPREDNGKFAKKGSGSSSQKTELQKLDDGIGTTKDFINQWSGWNRTAIYDNLIDKGGLSSATWKTNTDVRVGDRLSVGIIDVDSEEDWDNAKDMFLQALEDNPKFKKVFKKYEKEVKQQNKALQKRYGEEKTFYRGGTVDELEAIFGEYEDKYYNPEWRSRYNFKSLSMNYIDTLKMYNGGMMIHFNGDSVRESQSKLVNYKAEPTKYLHANVDSSIDQEEIENIDTDNPAFLLDEEEVRVNNENMNNVKIDKIEIFMRSAGFGHTSHLLHKKLGIDYYGDKRNELDGLVNNWYNDKWDKNGGKYFNVVDGKIVDKKTNKVYEKTNEGLKKGEKEMKLEIQNALMKNKKFREKVKEVVIK